jgi:signal transduction histidine kinase
VDAVLLDLRLPDGSGVECVHAIREVSREVAIVVLTGLDHESLALECIVAGAQDYIRKHDIRAESLRRAIGYSIARVREASAHRQADTLKEQLRHAQKLEALGTLSAGIAHDLNNTLLPITTMTSLMLETATDETTRTGLEIILKSAQRAKVLVREILQFSRKEQGERTPVRLDLMVADALTIIRAALPAFISCQVEAEPVPAILANEGQFYQIVLNLVMNAAQAIGDRPGTVVVGVRNHIREGWIQLYVEDDGPGMGDATRARIFEPFFTTKAAEEGTGLGLAVVTSIVADLGGMISVASKPGAGTRFTLEFPVMRVD